MSKRVRIVLRVDVPKLGKRGEVVNVSLGYAKNFVLPQHLGALADDATPHEAALYSARSEKAQARQEEERSALLERLKNTHLHLTMKANEAGVLYGSVGADVVINALANVQIRGISKTMIVLQKKIDHIGDAQVQVRLDAKTSCIVPLTITAA